MTRFFFFLFGFGIMVIGLVFIILYLNLLSIGYKFSEYVNYISKSPICYFSLIGFIIMNLSIYLKGDIKHGFRI